VTTRLLLAFAAVPALLFSQVGEPLPSFEVATIKLSGPNDHIIGMFTYPGGRITATNCTAETLIEEAFDVQPFQVAGGPGWMKDIRFNLEARPPASSKSSKSNPASIKLPPNDEQRQMLRSLLIERFQLKYQMVSRDGPNYILVKNGKQLRLEPPKDANGFPWVGNAERAGAINGDGVAGQNASMALLAKRLTRYVGRPILDQTGIEGSFDFRFDYAVGDDKPDVAFTIFTSLQALGLKLEPGRGPVETIMITAIEKPSDN
jgi:uncharacterized protein (TIGR03435 family)